MQKSTIISNVLRWLHTARHLRLKQIYRRVWFRLYCPAIDLSPSPSLRIHHRLPLLIQREHSLIHPWVFRFLNEEHEVVNADEWDSPLISKLWRYNLHYFDDLTAKSTEKRSAWYQELILRWIHENPPGHGTGWEPYPTSRRMVNWIKWAFAGNTLTSECQHSLAVQARWLSRRLEHHLLGNHLWTNAKALVFVGVFFQGPEADRWLTSGLKILRHELQEQVLSDGGHFERSPMYHSIILADLLDLVQLGISYHNALPQKDIAAWCEAIPCMLHWLSVMTHPDAEIALFNDSAFGIAPRLTDIVSGAKALGINFDSKLEGSIYNLHESGYIRLQKGPAVIIADIGNIGPDYLPGHAHADTLSFEMSLYGQRLIVDTGTSRYDVSKERLMQRETRAHNTVQIDEEDSSEVWSSFRVARRARPMELMIKQELNVLTVGCAHDGYKRLHGRPLHRRHWNLSDKRLLVNDSIVGKFSKAVACFHFHPEIRVVANGKDATGSLLLPKGKKVNWRVNGGHHKVFECKYHPEFGLSIPNHRLEVELDGCNSEVEFSWD